MRRVLFAPLVLLLGAGLASVRPASAQSGWFWQNPLPQGNTLFGSATPVAGTVYAVGGAGTILKSTDGGITWTPQSSGTTLDLSGVAFTDTNTGTAVGEYGTILRTNTGGNPPTREIRRDSRDPNRW